MFWCILRKYFLFSLLLLFTIVVYSCNNNPVIPKDPVFSLTAEDASCIEVWLRIKLDTKTEVNLFRNDSLIKNLSTFSGDAVIVDEGLLPSQDYTYRAEIKINDRIISSEASVRTMDTTSHNFTWQSWEFGEHSSSVFFDVAIIDENNIWAVGEIFMYDSLGQKDPIAYNAVHWDGVKWELKKISINYRDNIITPPLYGIYAKSASEIWLSAGVPIKGDGTNWTQYHLFDMGILNQQDGYLTKIWANASSVYFVGTLGTIAHYNGTNWKRIESGTEYNINDIWGDYNEKTDQWEILAVGGNILEGLESERVVLRIKETQAEIINAEGTLWPLSSIWFLSGKKYFAVGSGIYSKIHLSDSIWHMKPKNPIEYHKNWIRGTSINNTFIAGAFGELLYFNGIRWSSYQNDIEFFSGNYKSIAIMNEQLIAVGISEARAKITLGIKN
jgi:hypothetical protein